MNPDASTAPVAPAPTPDTSPVSAPPRSGWPGAFGIFKLSKQAVRVNVSTILLAYVGVLLIAIVLSILLKPLADGDTTKSLFDPPKLGIPDILNLLIDTLLTGVLTWTWLASTKGQKVSLKQALSKGASYYLKLLALTLMTYAAVIVSFVALIIPFFFVFPRIILAPYFLIDKNLGPVEALKASWAQTKGHALKMWGIVGVVFLMVLLMVTIIGIPVSLYLLLMYSASGAILYNFITGSPLVAAHVDVPVPAAQLAEAPVAPAPTPENVSTPEVTPAEQPAAPTQQPPTPPVAS